MLAIQRLNMDNTWLMHWNDCRLLIDPWLIGSEIDGAKWFNEQWHATAPVALDQLPDYDGIVVTQSYNDHCHLDTLERLDEALPIFAMPKPVQKIQKAFPQRAVQLIPDFTTTTPLDFKGLTLYTLAPNRRFDPIYYALVLAVGKEALVLAPHGFEFLQEQLDFLAQFKIRLLGTTFSVVELPGFMGGRVNPGMDNALKLIEQLQPNYVVNTHDEQKHARGIVMRIAKTEYPDLSTIRLDGTATFLHVDHYDRVELA